MTQGSGLGCMPHVLDIRGCLPGLNLAWRGWALGRHGRADQEEKAEESSAAADSGLQGADDKGDTVSRARGGHGGCQRSTFRT